jgi:hypothetical protein
MRSKEKVFKTLLTEVSKWYEARILNAINLRSAILSLSELLHNHHIFTCHRCIWSCTHCELTLLWYVTPCILVQLPKFRRSQLFPSSRQNNWQGNVRIYLWLHNSGVTYQNSVVFLWFPRLIQPSALDLVRWTYKTRSACSSACAYDIPCTVRPSKKLMHVFTYKCNS